MTASYTIQELIRLMQEQTPEEIVGDRRELLIRIEANAVSMSREMILVLLRTIAADPRAHAS